MSLVGVSEGDGWLSKLPHTPNKSLKPIPLEYNPSIHDSRLQAGHQTKNWSVSDGDVLLIDECSFPLSMNLLQPFASRNIQIVAIPLTGQGTCTATLERIVSDMNVKAFLTIPTGQNPTGTDMQLCAMQEVYKLAAAYNFWIIEDDPYFHTHFEELHRPSYLSLDTDGIVIRLDSFSKWMAPGFRCGWVTAHPQVIRKLVPTLSFASSISQVILYKILSTWGEDGLAKHMDRLHHIYKQRCMLLLAELGKLGEDIEVVKPNSGMFVWVRIICQPWSSVLETASGQLELMQAMRSANVTVVPGNFFTLSDRSAHIRISFASVSEIDIVEGVHRLKQLLQPNQPELNS